MGRVSKKTALYGFPGKDITVSHLFLLMEIVKCRLSKGKNKDFHLVVLAGIMSLLAAKLVFQNHIHSSTCLSHEAYHLWTIHSPDHVWRSIVHSNHIYNDEEFLCHTTYIPLDCRLDQGQPWTEGKNSRKESQHFSAELHVLVMLKWFGAEGSQSPPKWLRDNLGLSKGTVNSYVNRAVDALLSLKD